ncbi:MAG: hypothetical protein AAGG75_22500 [Bacteroidota bacterium]
MTSSKDNFFIGWSDQTPEGSAQASRRFVYWLLPAIVLVLFLFVSGQQVFTNSFYDFGNSTPLSGVLYKSPVPILRIILGPDQTGQAITQDILLIGAGKFGAEPTIAAMEAEQGQNLEGQPIQLEGVVSYYDGKVSLELLGGPSAFKGKARLQPMDAGQAAFRPLGDRTLKGEIVDSKCFFGLMKPGEGKTHRSCAVRCLSGGIPPVFAANTAEDRYYILRGPSGESINQELLPYVADYLQIEGRAERRGDWNILYLDPVAGICTLGPKWVFGGMPMCGE